MRITQIGFIVLGIDYLFGDGVQFHSEEAGFELKSWAYSKLQPAKDATVIWIEAVKTIYGTGLIFFAVDETIY